MIGIGRVYTLAMGLEHFLAPKIHSNFNLKNKITEKFETSVISIFLHNKKLTLPCAALEHVQNHFSDWLIWL